MRRVPSGYTVAFIASLAIGVAVACTAFAVTKRAFLDPLPYPDADRLLTIRTVVDGRESLGSSFQFGEELRGSGMFTDVSADWGRTLTYEAPGASERVSGGAVTANYFDVLGIKPALGDTLAPGARDEVVISSSFHQRVLGGTPSAIGAAITLDGVVHRIVGVMPPDFVAPYLSEAVMWVALDTDPLRTPRARGARSVILQARLAEGRSLGEAKAFLDAFGEQQRARHPEAFSTQTWVIDPLQTVLIEPSRALLMAAAAATVLLVLIVLANIAGLATVRAAEIRRGSAVRLALGASHARLLGERLRECFALAGIGTAAGVWLAWLSINWIVSHQQQFQLFMEDVPPAAFDGVVIAAALLVGVLAALVAALVPLRASRGISADELLGTARGLGGPRLARTRAALVVVQVAVAVVLLISAGLLVRTVNAIGSTALGFSSARLAMFSLTLPAARYDNQAKIAQLERDLLERLANVATIDGITASLGMPATGGPEVALTIAGRDAEGTRAVSFAVAPGFFEFLRVPLTAGREFAATDTPASPPVVVVNAMMARTYFPGGDAVGARFRMGGGGANARDVTVIGVVPDLRQDGPARDVRPTVFESTTQRAVPRRTFTIRTSQPLSAVAADIRAAVHGIDPLLALPALQTLEARLESQVVQQTFAMSMVTMFGAIAAGLCALGLYAVVSLSAQSRRHEFAMRMALGARHGQVTWLVVRQSVWLAAVGAAAGVAASFWLTRALAALLYGVEAGDPSTFVTTAIAMLVLAVAAAVHPALRAARINPVSVLLSN